MAHLKGFQSNSGAGAHRPLSHSCRLPKGWKSNGSDVFFEALFV